MPSTYTTDLRLELQANGENGDTWGTKVNTVFQLIEDAVAGLLGVSTTGGDTTLTAVNGSTDQSRYAILKVTGVLVSNSNIIVPDVSKEYLVWNATSGAYTVTIKTSAGTGVVVTQGAVLHVFCDGAEVYPSAVSLTSAQTLTNKTLTSPTISGGSITGITDLVVADGGTGVSTLTGLVKGNGTSAFSAAVANTDYATPTYVAAMALALG